MRLATGEMNGTLVTKALPACRAAREVSTTPIAIALLPPINSDETGSPRSAKQSQSDLASGETIEAHCHSRVDCIFFPEV